MKVYATEHFEGNDCLECPPQFDSDSNVIRPAGLMTLDIGRRNGIRLRLCLAHAALLSLKLSHHVVTSMEVDDQ